MKILSLSLVVLAIGCSRQQPTAAKAPPPAPKPAPTYMPPMSPAYSPPAYTAAPDSGAPPADAGAAASKNEASSSSSIPDKLTVTPEGAFKDGEKASIFVRAKARECFRDALRIDPKIAGRASAKLTIDKGGKTTSVEVSLDGTLPASLGKCIEKKSKGAFFSKPSSAPVTVLVPMTLSLKKPKS